jgi:hypothetical protein
MKLRSFPKNIQNYIYEKHQLNLYNWIHIVDNTKIPESIMILVTNKSEIESIKQWLACI